MPFSTSQRKAFVDAIQKKYGWNLDGDTIFSPGKGLWFSPSHFQDWSPAEMHEIFVRRAKRIERAQIGDRWEETAIENHQVHRVIEDLGWVKETD